MEITDIIFNHEFYGTQVYKKYVLDDVEVKYVVASYSCKMKGIFVNNSITEMFSNFEVILDKPKSFKDFVRYSDITKQHYMDWGNDKIKAMENEMFERIKVHLLNEIKNVKDMTVYTDEPIWFLNDEKEDDNKFKGRRFPLKNIEKKEYSKNEDIFTIYKGKFTEHWTLEDHLLLCDYIAGSLKKISKETLRRKLYHRSFCALTLNKNLYFLKIFDHYFNSPTIQE